MTVAPQIKCIVVWLVLLRTWSCAVCSFFGLKTLIWNRPKLLSYKLENIMYTERKVCLLLLKSIVNEVFSFSDFFSGMGNVIRVLRAFGCLTDSLDILYDRSPKRRAMDINSASGVGYCVTKHVLTKTQTFKPCEHVCCSMMVQTT